MILKSLIENSLKISFLFAALFIISCGGSGTTTVSTPADVTGSWSDPDIWGGEVPKAGADVVITSNMDVTLDVSPPQLASLTIEGQLEFANADLEIEVGYIYLTGELWIGTTAAPFEHNATITLTDTDSTRSIHGLGTRGIIVEGGKLELHGLAPETAWTKLSQNMDEGTQTAQVLDATGWKVGDRIAITPTDYYRLSETESFTIDSINSTTLTLNTPVNATRWGQLQYIDSGGVTLTPTTDIINRVLDERAEVANLTRPILIQGVDDALWQNDNFGGHVIVAHGGEMRMEGTMLHRMGQAGHLARYPIHFHHLSYGHAGLNGQDLENVYVRKSVVDGSRQRCIIVHASNGVELSDNICHDIVGHGIFLEDAVEQRTIIENNLVTKVRNPEESQRLLAHEEKSSGFWLTNPNNELRGNVAADAEGFGFWYAIPEETIGGSKAVEFSPNHMKFGVFDDNIAHSNQRHGLHFDNPPINDAGETYPVAYRPTTDGVRDSWDNLGSVPLNRFVTYKHLAAGVWNRMLNGVFTDWTVADNWGGGFTGAGNFGEIDGALIVGTSLNVGDVDAQGPHYWGQGLPRYAAASYHSEFVIHDNVIVNYPLAPIDELEPEQPSGAFATNDYYTKGVDLGLYFNANNTMINSHPGFRVQPPSEFWTFSGALWDPYGYWGDAENYWVFDNPFFSTDATCTPVTPISPTPGNGLSCLGPYYGVGSFSINGSDRYTPAMAINVTRYNDSDVEIGQWNVGPASQALKLNNMRHFAARNGGYYALEFPDDAPPTDLAMRIDNAYRDSDRLVLALEFAGTTDAQGYINSDNSFTAIGAHGIALPELIDRAALLSSPDSAMYQDVTNNLVWVVIYGKDVEDIHNSGDALELYQPMALRIYP